MMNPSQKIKQAFNSGRRLRSHRIAHTGSMNAIKLHPVACKRFAPDEGGTVSTSLNISLAPVSGLMRSRAYVDVKQVFVPYQALEKLYYGDEKEDAGVTEMTKRRLLANEGIGLEEQGKITKALYVHPRSIGGVKKVSQTVRLAYIAASNHLRKAAYYDAELTDKDNEDFLPAILNANVLERFNGVMSPETLVDGAVNLTGDLPVSGIERTGEVTGSASASVTSNGDTIRVGHSDTGYAVFDITKGNNSNITADLSGAGEISLRDLMQSRKLDHLVREFAKMVQDDPIHGEERVARALYGLSVDFDADCQVLYDRVHEIAPQFSRPTDGDSLNEVSTNYGLTTNFATVVPRSQLGGQLITIISVKPLEVLKKQPDPDQTVTWGLTNRVHDELELDEQLLTRADLESGLDEATDEDTSAFWVGHNKLLHSYASSGPNAQQTEGVEMLSSMWQYDVPTSITPSNIVYPDLSEFSMYPFYNWNGGHAEYTLTQVAAISTPLALGPNPVERIQLFADDSSLIFEDEVEVEE